MRRVILPAALLVTAVFLAPRTLVSAAPDVTFTKDVAPILHAKCVTCHRAGEVAPMALLHLRGGAAVGAVDQGRRSSTRQMPPWFADPHGRHVRQRSAPERRRRSTTIAKWVDAGAPQGDPKDMPTLPKFTDGWQLGEPDMIVELPEVQIPATGDDYLPDAEPDARPHRRSLDPRRSKSGPSNREVTHHSVIFCDVAGAMSPMAGGGADRVGGFFDVLGVWAVGTPPTVYPEGTGRWVRKGQMLRTNLHYHPNGTAQIDRTRVGLYFGKGELKKEVVAGAGGQHHLHDSARRRQLTRCARVYIVDQDINVVSLFPHMHLRGKDMKMTATFPDGAAGDAAQRAGVRLQLAAVLLPEDDRDAAARARASISSRTTTTRAANKHNPDPTKAVTFGEASTDEMMFGMFEFTADAGVSPKPSTDASGWKRWSRRCRPTRRF